LRITFDAAKDAANFAKHAVLLSLVLDMEWDTTRRIISLRKANLREIRRYAET
jgi:uncharacterized DUF497 family protein